MPHFIDKQAAPSDNSRMNDQPLLTVNNLAKHFPVTGGVFSSVQGHVKAVDGVDFTIERGKTLGLVGESGCGKTTTGRLVIRLIPQTAGSIQFEGEEITTASRERMRKLRRGMQIIFQDPYASLNPRMTVGATLAEPFHTHNIGKKNERRDMAVELLGKVGLSTDSVGKYPHEFSGGQRQRIGIARAIALNPKLIVCDEPVSALDVSIQAQIVNLLRDLKEEFNISYLFISHDLTVVEKMCDEVAVMYLGKIMERGASKEIYNNPKHPYTEALLSATPEPDPSQKTMRTILEGDVPSPINPPSGCVFRTRCPIAEDECAQTEPELSERGEGHLSACHLR